MGALVMTGVVGMHLVDAGHRFTDATGQVPRRRYPFLGQFIDAFLQARNNIQLERVKRYRGQPEEQVLLEDEKQVSDQGAALKHRQGKGLTDEFSQRFGFGGNHRDYLARRDAFEMWHRKTQDARIQLVTQASQQPFSERAPVDIQQVLQAAAPEHGQQEGKAENHQKVEPVELITEQAFRDVHALEQVDDFLG